MAQIKPPLDSIPEVTPCCFTQTAFYAMRRGQITEDDWLQSAAGEISAVCGKWEAPRQPAMSAELREYCENRKAGRSDKNKQMSIVLGNWIAAMARHESLREASESNIKWAMAILSACGNQSIADAMAPHLARFAPPQSWIVFNLAKEVKKMDTLFTDPSDDMPRRRKYRQSHED